MTEMSTRAQPTPEPEPDTREVEELISGEEIINTYKEKVKIQVLDNHVEINTDLTASFPNTIENNAQDTLELSVVFNSASITAKALGFARARSLYVPKRSIGRRDSFVIIDDVVRTGNTVKALVDLVTGQRADIAGVYVIVAVGDVWRMVLGRIIDRYSFDTFIEMRR